MSSYSSESSPFTSVIIMRLYFASVFHLSHFFSQSPGFFVIKFCFCFRHEGFCWPNLTSIFFEFFFSNVLLFCFMMFHLHLQWPLKCNNCDWPAPWLLQKYAGAAWKQNRKTQFLVIGDYNYDTLIKKYL